MSEFGGYVQEIFPAPKITRAKDAQEAAESFRSDVRTGKFIPGPEFIVDSPNTGPKEYRTLHRTIKSGQDYWSEWKILGFANHPLPVSSRSFVLSTEHQEVGLLPETIRGSVDTYAQGQGFAGPQELITLAILRNEANRLGKPIVWKVDDMNGGRLKKFEAKYAKDQTPENLQLVEAQRKEHEAWLALYKDRLGMKNIGTSAKFGYEMYMREVEPDQNLPNLEAVSQLRLQRSEDGFDYQLQSSSLIKGDHKMHQQARLSEYEQRLQS